MSVPPSASQPGSESAPLPLWARAADALSLTLIGLTLLVTMTGGFRLRIGSLRIAVTSPLRLLVAAVVIALVRYLLVPRRPVFAELGAAANRLFRTAPARTALVAVAGTRPAILFVGYFAVAAFGYVHERPPVRFSSNEAVNLQARWDAAWYLNIATEGYRFDARAPREQQNIVFFPAYPMAVRIAGRLLGGSVGAHLLGGTIVSWAAFLVALAYLFRLARDLIGTEDGARAAVLLLAAYPFALFYGAIYTESLYLLGAVAACYHARRREYLACAAWGLMVGLTRPNGCFLSLPLLLIAAAPWLPAWLHTSASAGRRVAARRVDSTDAPSRTPPSLTLALTAAAATGVGVLAYAAFVWQMTGNPLAWEEGHAAWGRE
ncbi:MAG: mannosyltransferase family protein, partial [Vicinamibacterales bacterium]